MDKLHIAIIVTILAVPSGAAAGEQAIELTRQHVRSIDGSIEPESVPDHVKYTYFFDAYLAGYRDSLALELTPRDDSILVDAATNHESRREQQWRGYYSKLRQLCSDPVTNSYFSLIKQREGIADGSNFDLANYYRSILERLSPAGQSAVRRYVDDEITPSIVTAEYDVDGLFAEEPEAAKEEFEAGCFYAVNGYHSPETQKIIEENREIGRRRAEQLMEQARRERTHDQ